MRPASRCARSLVLESVHDAPATTVCGRSATAQSKSSDDRGLCAARESLRHALRPFARVPGSRRSATVSVALTAAEGELERLQSMPLRRTFSVGHDPRPPGNAGATPFWPLSETRPPRAQPRRSPGVTGMPSPAVAGVWAAGQWHSPAEPGALPGGVGNRAGRRGFSHPCRGAACGTGRSHRPGLGSAAALPALRTSHATDSRPRAPSHRPRIDRPHLFPRARGQFVTCRSPGHHSPPQWGVVPANDLRRQSVWRVPRRVYNPSHPSHRNRHPGVATHVASRLCSRSSRTMRATRRTGLPRSARARYNRAAGKRPH